MNTKDFERLWQKIAEVASSAVNDSADSDASYNNEMNRTFDDREKSCTLKYFPKRLLVSAAETATKINLPRNVRRELVAMKRFRKAYEYFPRTQGSDRQTVDQQVLTPLDQRSIFGTASATSYRGSITRNVGPILDGVDINQTDFDLWVESIRDPDRSIGCNR